MSLSKLLGNSLQDIRRFVDWDNVTLVKDYVTAHPWKVVSGTLLTLAVLRYFNRPRNLPPGPLPLPIVGNMHLLSDEMHKDYYRIAKQYGDITSVWVGGVLQILLNTDEVVKEAFVKRGSMFSDRDKNDFFLNLWNDELFSRDYTDVWKGDKKFLMLTLRQYGFGTKKGEANMLEEVNNLIEHFSSHGDNAFDPAEPLLNTSACIITNILLGTHYKWEDKQLEEYQILVNRMGEMFTDHMFFILIGIFLMPQWLTKILLPTKVKSISEPVRDFQAFFRERIKDHRESLDPDNPRDVLDSYLIERYNGEHDPKQYNDIILGDTFGALSFDSVHTMRNLNLFVLLLAIKHPEVQKNIHEEMDRVLGTRSPGIEDRKELHYLEATILEMNRYISVASTTAAHVVSKATTLRGYNIPTNAQVIANLYTLHYDEKTFPEPEKFKPERFLDVNGKFVMTDSVKPFGCGPRMCVGEQLTKMEVFLVCASLFHRFEFSFPEDAEIPPDYQPGTSFKMPPKFKIIAKPR